MGSLRDLKSEAVKEQALTTDDGYEIVPNDDDEDFDPGEEN